MTILPADYRDRVYAGWLGKCIGVRLGAPVENWTAAEIARDLGEIEWFLPLPPGKVFKPDDDTAVPLILMRALEDHGLEPTAEQLGETILNYVADGRGTFWWGGYGISTEHTAYANLAGGLAAPRSGSAELNGTVLAEQIGGQIFSDLWGLVVPNQPARAAAYAERASRVTHDGEAVLGGRFVAALVSAAFSEREPARLIEAGLAVIPPASAYARVMGAMLAFHAAHPGDWRAAQAHLAAHFGYDRYRGLVPVIPNAGVIGLALLYSEGDFSRAVRIATMAGWDTDCNAGNVGAIMATAVGLAGIDAAWRRPMNDELVAASLIGSRNCPTIAACADRLAGLGAQIAGAPAPARPRFHFDYPGSTQGFCAEARLGEVIDLRQTAAQGADQRGVLQVTLRDLKKKGEARAFARLSFRPGELSANYYGATFSPALYPGQTLTARVGVPATAPAGLQAALWTWDDLGQTEHQGPAQLLEPGRWHSLAFTLPGLEGAQLTRVGLALRTTGEAWSGPVWIDWIDWQGPAQMSTRFARERSEYGAISGWTFLRGYWRLEDGAYHGSGPGLNETYTGDPGWQDVVLTVDVVPLAGEHHRIGVRVQGACRGYAAGLAPNGQIALYKNQNGWRTLAQAPCAWQLGRRYQLRMAAAGPRLAVSVDGELRLSVEDAEAVYLRGLISLGCAHGSHTRFEAVTVFETPSPGAPG